MLQISQKTFLLGGLVLFFIASAVLFTLHDRALDPDQTGNWWAVRFVDPNDPNNLAFEIENHTSATEGDYEVIINGVLQEMSIFETSINTIAIVTPAVSSDVSDRTNIIIKLGDQKQSLTR